MCKNGTLNAFRSSVFQRATTSEGALVRVNLLILFAEIKMNHFIKKYTENENTTNEY